MPLVSADLREGRAQHSSVNNVTPIGVRYLTDSQQVACYSPTFGTAVGVVVDA